MINKGFYENNLVIYFNFEKNFNLNLNEFLYTNILVFLNDLFLSFMHI